MKPLITMPTYNEAENLAGIVTALFSLAIEGLEIMIIDDSSRDDTGDIAETLA